MVYGLSLGGMGFWRATGEYLGFVEPRDGAPAATRATAAGTGIMPPSRSATGTITVDQALSIGAVYRAVSILVSSVSQMDLRVLRNGLVIPTPPLVRNPNVTDTRSAFVEETVWSLACYGNAYWRLTRDGNAAVQSIQVLDPSLVGVNMDPETGRVTYSFNGVEQRPGRIKHLKFMRRPGQALGLGPIQAARGELTGALRLREFADQWFDTSGVPTGALSTDQALSPEEADEYAEAWQKFIRENRTAVLGQGLAYAPIALDPAKAQYIDVQRENTKQIARLFGIPATYLLSDAGNTSMTYSNQQDMNIVFLQTTLARYVTEIENALSDLIPRGQVVQFDDTQLLRLNTQARTDIDVKLVKAGLRTVNEVRAKDNLAPVPWGDDKPAAPARPGSEQGATDDNETEDGDAA